MSSHPQLLTPIAFQFVCGQRGTWQLHAALKVALSRVPKWLQLGDLRVKFHPVDDSWSKSYLEDLCRITWYHFVFGETVKNCFFAARTPTRCTKPKFCCESVPVRCGSWSQAPVASTRNGSERQVFGPRARHLLMKSSWDDVLSWRCFVFWFNDDGMMRQNMLHVTCFFDWCVSLIGCEKMTSVSKMILLKDVFRCFCMMCLTVL